jgi:hypothetical protein
MDTREPRYAFGLHGMDECGRLYDWRYDGSWRLVRELHPDQFASVKAACERLPERAPQLLEWLDPESHARDALSEDNAWALLARMLG